MINFVDKTITYRKFLIQHAVYRSGSNVNYGLYTDEDDNVIDAGLPSDAAIDFTDVGAFFKRGREYESVFVNHRYTGDELKVLAGYESLNYLPPDSKVHR